MKDDGGDYAAELRSTFGHSVRACREALGVSQRKFARQNGITQGLLTIVESGGRDLKISTMARLALALGGAVPTMLTKKTGPGGTGD